MAFKTYTPVGLKIVFEKIKFKVLHFIHHDFIRQHPGLSKDQISMFKSPVINYFILKIVTYSNGYIKGDKYFFSYKSRCGKWAPETAIWKNRHQHVGIGLPLLKVYIKPRHYLQVDDYS